MKDQISHALQTVKVLNPYQDFVSYFVPVFALATLGFYFNNPVIREIFSLSKDLHIVANIAMVLVVCFAIGKVISEVTGYVLAGLHILMFWLGLIVYKITKIGRHKDSVQGFRKWLHQSISEEHEHADEVKLGKALEKDLALKARYARVLSYATAMQTAFGGLVVLIFMYQGNAHISHLAILVLLFVLLLSARKHLAHLDESIQETI